MIQRYIDESLPLVKEKVHNLLEDEQEFQLLEQLFRMATPEEWLDVDVMSEITNYIALERPDCVDLGIYASPFK